MSEIDVNGTTLYYEEAGDGPPILCVHGTGSSALVWGEAIERLSRYGRVIAYDRRGCTRSPLPDGYETTTVGEHADDAVALIAALDAAPAIVIGRSYGGEVALDLALRHPNSVRALAVLEGAPLSLSPEAERWDREFVAQITAAARPGRALDRSGGPGGARVHRGLHAELTACSVPAGSETSRRSTRPRQPSA